MARFCKNKCGNAITHGSKSGLCKPCAIKAHSEHIRKLWKSGRYDNRDESYRDNEEYKQGVSKSVKQLWDNGVYSEERNKKISKAHKGKPKPWLHKTYSKICEYCSGSFNTKIKKKRFCNTSCSAKGVERKIDKDTEKIRRQKISKALKGRIPANLKQNIKSNNSFRQKEMFDIVNKYFSDAKFNYYIKTNRSFRFLDTAVPSRMLDFEYDGKVHLMKSVKINDSIRKKELSELGWKRITINRKNFHNLDKICKGLTNGDLS